jgi:hypothetical protein
MVDNLLYHERLPKYAFNGIHLSRTSIQLYRDITRLLAVSTLIVSFTWIYHLLFIWNLTSDGVILNWIIIGAMWVGCACLLYNSEVRDKRPVDGYSPTSIFEDGITIPPRFYRKLIGRPDSIPRSGIDHVVVVRGRGRQFITRRWDTVIWKGAPIGLLIVLKSGKKYDLGYKLPSTVKQITDTLSSRWNIKVEDPGTGMGYGMRFIDHQHIGDFPYEEIMQMNIIQWKD